MCLGTIMDLREMVLLFVGDCGEVTFVLLSTDGILPVPCDILELVTGLIVDFCDFELFEVLECCCELEWLLGSGTNSGSALMP